MNPMILKRLGLLIPEKKQSKPKKKGGKK